MNSILIIDDEEGIRSILSDILQDEGYQVATAEDGIIGLEMLKTHPVDLVFLDIRLPNKGGIDVLKEIREDFPGIETIMISGHASVDLAVSAIKKGAFDFIEKPLSLERVTTLAANALKIEALKRENLALKQKISPRDELIGESTPMKEIKDRLKQAAGSEARILITGENGTGKELIAREIHEGSPRREAPFVEVNCAAIPDTLIESELFGHEKGSFTGAVASRKGKFEQAHGGTLFLDEIADMSLTAQAKVLRAIQEQVIERVGGNESISVDLRIIAATNKNLENAVSRGVFREDLYFRLNVIPLHIPPLRERSEDIPLLANYFLQTLSPPEETERKISPEGMARVQAHPWPGNIRQLRNFIQRLLVMSEETHFSEETVSFFLEETRNFSADTSDEGGLPEDLLSLSFAEAKSWFEKHYIQRKLEEHQGNISKTAQAMGIYPSNLHNKIKKYGIVIER